MWRHPTADKWLLLPKSHDAARASQDLICIVIFNVQVCLEENYYLVLHFHDKATSIQIEEELNTKRSYTYVVADIYAGVCVE